MKPAIKLISTDFDGTIFAEFENPPVPHRLQAMIAELQAQGVKWIINTGRDMSSLMEALGRAHVSVHPDYLVLVEREVYRREQSAYVGLAEWNEACHRAHAEVFAQFKPHVPALLAWVSAHHPRTTVYADSYSPFCMIAGDNGDADAIQAHVNPLLRLTPNLAFVRNDVYARFSHVEFNKGTALGEITRRLSLQPSQVFAAGDWLNDLPMLDKRFAHFLTAPVNAIEPVKQALRLQGGHLSNLRHGNGVADGLEFYLQSAA
jgi:hydroxymethylpyrimidine pyrophosphatase-like HAD family hydrolase